ncbi:MAG: S1/P1 nuclease [Fimbriiglobus sp.]
MFRLCLVAMSLLLLGSQASAWNRAGHMVSGAIAYAVLKEDSPEILAKALVILKAHPQYDRLWKDQVEKIPAAERDLYLFMLAGRWADDIRGNKEYDNPPWHYINYPYKPAGEPDTVVPAEPDATANIVLAHNKNFDKLRMAPEALEGAVPMCWLFHLIGDIHQPLHSVSLFTEKFPKGDRGGTRFYVKVTQDRRAINLHAFWDDLITTTDDFRTARNIAIELRLRADFDRDELTELRETNFENWAKVEGVELAKKAVYLEGKLAGGAGELSAEVLPANYPRTVKPIAERRIVLSGYRIAETLKKALTK